MQKAKLIVRLVLSFAFALFLCAGDGGAQTSNGTIVGAVTDRTGGVVANGTVTVTSNDRGGDKKITTTDSSGTYRVQSLLPGRYKVMIEAQGFSPFVVNDIEVRASLDVTANAVLEITGATATVTVEASSSQELQTQSGEISSNISTAEVKNLPYLTGNPIEILLTEPGVQDVATRDSYTNGVGFSVNGTRPRANNFLLDGQDNNDTGITGQATQTINHEAIGEVTILENSASAEFGRGGGSVTNEVFKGGTNSWHGSGWDIIDPSHLSAILAEQGHSGITRNPVSISNTFGFSLGGPIKKDKLFFFATPQWSRFRANSGALAHTLLLPTANGVAALQQIEAAEGTNGNIDYLLASLGSLRGGLTNTQMISAGVGPGGAARPGVEFGDVLRGDTSIVSNNLQWSLRLDYAASDHDQLTARFFRNTLILTPDFFNNPDELATSESQQGGPNSNFHAGWVHTVSSKIVNELRFSYSDIAFAFSTTPAVLASPLATHFSVVFNDITNPTDLSSTNFGIPAGTPNSRNHKTYQFQDAFSWSFGKHSLKIGGDVALTFIKDGIPVDPRGTYTVFPGGACGAATCTGLANYIDNFSGHGGNVSRFFGPNTISPFAPNYAPYVEDTWRIKSNFTLTLGLRYEFWGTPENVLQFPAIDPKLTQGLAGATFPSAFAAQQIADKNNFAPRVGIAYTPHFWRRVFGGDKTVIRAGYGIFYDGLFSNILDNTAGGSPNGILQTVNGGSGRGFADASGTLLALQPQLTSTSNVFSIAANLRNPLTHQWNLNIERALPGGFIVSTAYVGTRGEHLFVNQDFNPFLENPNFGLVSARTNGGDSIYHSGQLKVERSFAHGLLLRGSYTYSKFIDDMSEVFITSGGSSRAQDLSNQSLERGPSAFDRRHRLAMTYLWELPYVRSHSNGFMTALNAITSGWQSSGTIVFSTGAPETVYDGFDANGDFYNNDRPNLVNPKAPFTSIGIDGAQLGLTPGSIYSFNDCVYNGVCNPADPNTFHFVIPGSGNGNLGRNTFTSPGFQNWNLSMQKTVKLKERYTFMVRGEFYNAFNHPNLGIPNLKIFNSTSTSFDNLANTINGGRVVVLWGKFSF